MKTNVLVNTFIAIIGLLLIVAALQILGWGRGINEIEPAVFDEGRIEQLVAAKDDLAAPDIKPEVIDRIIQTPLFREDRQPFVPPIIVEDGPGIDNPEMVEVKPLKVQVTSIIITSNQRYVMVQDQVSNERLTLKEGMPLEGEQGMWIVDNIDQRKVVFTAEGEEPVELELEVFGGALNKGANRSSRNRPQQANAPTANQNNKDDEKLSPEQLRQKKAEEIRQKIAERRAEMRAKAAQGKEQ